MTLSKNIFLLAIILTLFSSCAKKEQGVVDFGSAEKTVEIKADEVVLDDLKDEKTDGAVAQQSSQTEPQRLSDNSEVTVMYDGFGNKLERRYFNGHPRLDCVLIRTAANGSREVIVYGQTGERRTLAGEIVQRLLTASADEIANAAKIYETRSITQTAPTLAENKSSEPNVTALPPIRSPQLPAQQVETVQDQPAAERQEDTGETQSIAPAKEEKARVARKDEDEDEYR